MTTLTEGQLEQALKDIGFVRMSKSRFPNSFKQFCHSDIKNCEQIKDWNRVSNDISVDDRNSMQGHVESRMRKNKEFLNRAVPELEDYPQSYLELIKSGISAITRALFNLHILEEEESSIKQNPYRRVLSDLDNMSKNVKQFAQMKASEQFEILHLVVTSQSAREQCSDFLEVFNRLKPRKKNESLMGDQFDEDDYLTENIVQGSIDDICDLNRVVRDKAKYFKTLFIRYNSKKDQVLDKEIS